jgi:hypothetical protein
VLCRAGVKVFVEKVRSDVLRCGLLGLSLVDHHELQFDLNIYLQSIISASKNLV